MGQALGVVEPSEDDFRELRKMRVRRLLIAGAGVSLGCAAIVVGVAFIYWPAALILTGILVVAGCALLIEVPDIRPGGPEPR
jgi:hypothetical protein